MIICVKVSSRLHYWHTTNITEIFLTMSTNLLYTDSTPHKRSKIIMDVPWGQSVYFKPYLESSWPSSEHVHKCVPDTCTELSQLWFLLPSVLRQLSGWWPFYSRWCQAPPPHHHYLSSWLNPNKHVSKLCSSQRRADINSNLVHI